MRENRGLIIAGILSILLHVFLYFMPADFGKEEKGPKTIEISLKQLKFPDRLKSKKKQQQVVQTDIEQKLEEAFDDAAFLGKVNNRVREQTKAKSVGDFNNAFRMAGVPKPKQKKKAVDPRGKKQQDKLALAKKKLSMKDLMMKAGDILNSGSYFQAPSTDDHLKNIREGDRTLLNTKEFVFYSYYNRIREQVKQFWIESVRENINALFRRGRGIASDVERITKLLVVLSRDGKMVRIDVLESSGTPELDNAAVNAFKEASPFPNPPKGMVENDGTIRLRWDFILQTGASKGIQIEYSYM